MHAHAPPKEKRRLYGTALQKLRLLGSYHATAFLTKVFERPFWFFAQWRGRLADQIANEGSDE
jgi:hypothetical protein